MSAYKATLTISVVPGEPPTVTGPLEDRMLCYALLEIARDVVKDFKPSEIVMSDGTRPPAQEAP
jgi:hypothetical protein